MAAKRYFVVNPLGVVHEVTKEHAKELLKQSGWRMAKPDEIKALEALKGNQTPKRKAGKAEAVPTK